MSKLKKRMNQELPILKHLPKIPRFITENLSRENAFFFTKYVMVGGVCGFLIMVTTLEGSKLLVNLEESKKLQKEREQVIQEIAYWKQVGDTYSGYRDIYYRIAALQYKLGNEAESKAYIQKALELDPNFEEGRVLGAQIEATR